MDSKTIVIMALVLIMGWFAAGLLYNLRRGNAVVRWLQGGLPLLGEKTTFRWLGSSVAQMEIASPKRPFNKVNVMLVLAPRDVPWFWIISALRGRKDIFILRAQLAGTPILDLELANPAFWTGRMALGQAASREWICQAYKSYSLCAPGDVAGKARQALPSLEAALSPASAVLVRLALRCESQTMEVHLPLPDVRQDARAYFQALQKLARECLNDRSSPSVSESPASERVRGRASNAGTP